MDTVFRDIPGFRILGLIVLLAIAGCGTRGEFAFSSADAPGAEKYLVFVATSREPTDGKFAYGRERATETRFMRFNVSVPPGHETGEVEWPKQRLNPKKHFYVAGAEKYDSSAAFFDAVKRNTHPSEGGNGDVVVFVHGYNTNLAEGVYRVAQMTHDFEDPGTEILFSWPSAANPTGYIYDRDSVIHARDRLQELLEDLSDSGVKRVLLVGHSMGSYLVTETLRQMSLQRKDKFLDTLGGVVLMSPDIDVEVFRAQAEAIKPLPSPFVLLVAKQDQALRLSAFLTGKKQRLGSIEYLDELDDLNITVFDVTELADGRGLNHSVATTSPAAISVLRGLSGPEEIENLQEGTGQQSWLGGLNVFGNAVKVDLRPEERTTGS